MAPMHPVPIVMADWTRKNIRETKVKYYWHPVSGQHCLLGEEDIGAPLLTSSNSSVGLAYFHTNRLLTGLYKMETEIRWRKEKKLKSKLTSIATVRNRLRIVASIPTPSLFITHYLYGSGSSIRGRIKGASLTWGIWSASLSSQLGILTWLLEEGRVETAMGFFFLCEGAEPESEDSWLSRYCLYASVCW